jgi:hypothetical protein
MDLDTLLRDTSDIPDPTLLVLARNKAKLTTEVRRTGERSRRPLAAALVAAAAAVALIVGPTISVGGNQPRGSAEAAVVLMAAADAAGEQPGSWRDARYWRSVSSYRRGAEPLVRREIWIGHRETGVLRDGGVDSGVIPLEVGRFATGGTSVDWDGLFALPTEVEALERRLRAGINGAGPDDDSELFVIVGDLLRESPAPPALRRALWQVAARVPGVELVGAATDMSGRTGTAVRRGGTTYVVDQNDGRLLEEQSHGWRSTYLEQGPADSAPAVTNRGLKEQRG